MSGSIYNCYVYAYIRSKDSINGKAGTPYYIGKGTRRRLYNTSRTVPIPKDKRFIIILESNLSDVGALALERRYIHWYGRIDLGTGILRNMTDGGDGRNKSITSEETKEKIRRSSIGKIVSEETKQKMREACKNRPPVSEETKRKLRNSRKPKYNYTLISPDNITYNTISLHQFCKDNNLSERIFMKYANKGIIPAPLDKCKCNPPRIKSTRWIVERTLL